MSDQIPNNIADTILEQASREAESRVASYTAHDETPVDVLIARQGVTATILQDKLDAFADYPRSRAGRLQAFDVQSFAALVLRDHDAGSMIFADVGGAGVTFEACLDYHHEISRNREQDRMVRPGQRHGREVITYAPKLSKEWQAWTGQAGKEMGQAAFAQWIDDHLPDIADPRLLIDAPTCTAAKLGEVWKGSRENLWGYAEPDKLAEVSEGLQIREGAQVKNSVRLASGEVSFTYVTEHTDADGRPLKVPTRFLLSIPVFEREAEYLVPVKLAYRKSGGAIVWTFELFRPDRFRDDAIEGLRAGLEKLLTPAPIVDGKVAPVVPVMMAKRA